MEVLGAAATIVQLVTFAGQVVSEVRRYSKSVKNYPETAVQLVQQLETMRRVLGDLSTLITPAQLQSSNPGAPQTSPDTANLNYLIGDTVRKCEKSLQEVQEKIQAAKTSKPESRLRRWSSGFTKRMLWPFTEEETKEYIAAFGAHERQFLIAISAATFRKVNVVEEHTQAEKLRLLRKWISTTDYSSKYSRSLALRNRKTGGWLLADPTFKDWMTRKADSQIFWLNGIPGCGKTMLTSMVIEQVVMPADPDTAGAYFYCDGTDATTININNILRSVLVQLLFHDPNKTKPLITRLQRLRVTGEILPPHSSQLQDLIAEAASYYTEATVVIDALDECGRDVREELLPCLAYVVGKVTALRLFVSSRDEYDIREHLMPNAIDYSLGETSPASSLREDIKIYIQDEFDRKPRLRRLGTTLKFQISDRMLESENMFRWVQCQVDNITKCRSEDDIHHTLANLPAGLNETYEHALDRIADKTDILLARHTFQWLIGAKRPLRLSEIAAALDIAENEGPKKLLEEEELLDICGSLVSFDPATSVMRFSHITVQEFLLSGYLAKSERSHFSFCIANLEHQLTLACIRYLLSQDLNVDETGSSYGKFPDQWWLSLDQNVLRKQYKARPLLLYAARYWNRHLRFASPATDDLLYSLVIRLFTAPEHFGNYCSFLQARFVKDDPRIFCDPTNPKPVRTHIRRKSTMYYLIQSRAIWLSRRVAEQHPAWVDELEWGYGHGTPVMLAIKHNDVEMLRCLLDLGANPNKISAPSSGTPTWHPLHAAVRASSKTPHPSTSILQLLIARGANVNLRYRHAGNQTVLHLAAMSGTAEMVRILLEAGAYPSAVNEKGDSPLWFAVDRNSLEIVRLLVEGGAETDTFGTRHSPLWHALALRSPSIVEYLFRRAGCGFGQILKEIHEEDFLWAHDQPWHNKLVPHLTKQRDHLLGLDGSSESRPSKRDVYHILWIMQRLLKNEDSSKRIAARILDMAEVWIPVSASRHETAIVSETLEQLQPYELEHYPTRIYLRKESRANLQPYVAVALPPGLPQRVIRRLTFRTHSHDQGKVGKIPPLGYLWKTTGAGTWLEAAIVGDDHSRALAHVIHQNLPGVAAGMVHTNVWDLKERTNDEVRNWFTRPRGGVKIGVYARAYFEGWVNQVESVEIELRYAVGGAYVQSPRPQWSVGPNLDELGL